MRGVVAVEKLVVEPWAWLVAPPQYFLLTVRHQIQIRAVARWMNLHTAREAAPWRHHDHIGAVESG